MSVIVAIVLSGIALAIQVMLAHLIVSRIPHQQEIKLLRHVYRWIYLIIQFWPRELSTEICVLRLQGNLSEVGNVEDNRKTALEKHVRLLLLILISDTIHEVGYLK